MPVRRQGIDELLDGLESEFYSQCWIGAPPLAFGWPEHAGDVLWLPAFATFLAVLPAHFNGHLMNGHSVLAVMVGLMVAPLPFWVPAYALLTPVEAGLAGRAVAMCASFVAAAVVAAALAGVLMRTDAEHWFARFLYAICPKRP